MSSLQVLQSQDQSLRSLSTNVTTSKLFTLSVMSKEYNKRTVSQSNDQVKKDSDHNSAMYQHTCIPRGNDATT